MADAPKDLREPLPPAAAVDSDDLAAKLKAKFFGHDETIDQIASELCAHHAETAYETPRVLCFVGGPGVGKRYLARLIAENLYGDKSHFLHVEMATCGEPAASWGLFGSPPGYVGGPGWLTSQLKDMLDSVILLDNVHMAHPKIMECFLEAWNDGYFVDNRTQERITATKAMFILTVDNVAYWVSDPSGDHTGNLAELDRRLRTALVTNTALTPEVLSGIDSVFALHPVDGFDLARLFVLKAEELVTKSYGLAIAEGGIDPTIFSGTITKKKNEWISGRMVAREIEEQICDGLIDAKENGATRVRLEAGGDGIRVVPLHDDPLARPPGEI